MAVKRAWLLGSPVAHSRSPQIHQAAYAQLGKPWSLAVREVQPEHLASVLAELAGPELLGLNLTLPLKQVAFQHVREASLEAREAGAINCLRWNDDHWCGHNSDGQGWLDSFREELDLPLAGRKALLLGAGGACQAILAVLRRQGTQPPLIFNRTPARAQALLQGPERALPLDEFASHLEPHCLVVQTTSVGMWPAVAELPVEWPDRLPTGVLACDLIYNPSPTLWLRQAAERGARTLDGRGMLVHQAIRAIEFWSGLRADAEPMQAALAKSLGH